MDPILLNLPEEILTPRLRLRPPRSGDGLDLNEAVLETAEALRSWMPWAQTLPNIADSEVNVRRARAQWILREDLRYDIHDRDTDRFLGGSGLHRIRWHVPSFEIGFWIRKSAEGKGYVTESTNALTRFAFESLGAKRVSIHCDSRNLRSKSVIERLGFELEGRLRNDDRSCDGEALRDTLIYSRLNTSGLPDLDVSWR